MTDTTALTDRYIWAAVRTAPEAKRAELDAELRERIGDAIDARLAGGESPEAAERAVLLELGDPERLAAEYLGRPLQLIGPAHYLAWRRLLKLLLVTVLPSAFGALILAGLIQQKPVGDVIWGAIWTAFIVGIQLCFWVTLAFVIVEHSPERTPRRRLGTDPWSLDQLPELPADSFSGMSAPGIPGLPALPRTSRLRGTRTSDGEVIAVAVLSALLIVIIVWQQFNPFTLAADGSPIPVLQPELWSFFLPYAIALIAADVAVTVAAHLARRWTWGLAAAHAVVTLALTVPTLWLFATGRLINPVFLDAVGLADEPDVLRIVLIVAPVVVVAATVWDIIDRFLWVARTGRSGRPSGPVAVVGPR